MKLKSRYANTHTHNITSTFRQHVHKKTNKPLSDSDTVMKTPRKMRARTHANAAVPFPAGCWLDRLTPRVWRISNVLDGDNGGTDGNRFPAHFYMVLESVPLLSDEHESDRTADERMLVCVRCWRALAGVRAYTLVYAVYEDDAADDSYGWGEWAGVEMKTESKQSGVNSRWKI